MTTPMEKRSINAAAIAARLSENDILNIGPTAMMPRITPEKYAVTEIAHRVGQLPNAHNKLRADQTNRERSERTADRSPASLHR
jgi:hypothetical protein